MKIFESDQQRAWLYPLSLVFFSLLVVWNSINLPLGEAPDESDHLAVARFIAQTGHPPLSQVERRAAGPKGGLAPFYYQILAQPLRLVDGSNLADLRVKPDRPGRYIPEDGLGVSRILHIRDEQPPYRGLALVWHWLRLTSLLFALGTLATANLIGRALFGRSDLALAIMLFVAFVPRFVISSAVLNDDNLVNFLIVLFLLLLLKIVDAPEQPLWYFMAGIVLGFAILTKYNSLLLLLEPPVVFGYLLFKKQLAWRRLAMFLGWLMVGIGLVAGPWYGFILARFNRIEELGLISGLVAALAEPQVTAGFVRHLNQGSAWAGATSYSPTEWLSLLYRSFWFEYGRMQLFAQPIFYWLYGALGGLALVGWGIYCKRMAPRISQVAFIYWLALFHLLLFGLAPSGRYLLTPTLETTQGRQLFPALPVIGALFIFGLAQLLGGRFYRPIGLGLAALGLIGNLIFVETVVKPAYIYLPVTTGETNRFQIAAPRVEDMAETLTWRGYTLEPQAQAGRPYQLRLYWQAEQALTRDYWLRVCLVDAQGDLAACQQGHFVAGRYPTRSWEAGDFVEETITLPLPNCLAAGTYHLTMDVAALDPTQRLVREPLNVIYRAELPEAITIQAAANPTSGGTAEVWDQGGRWSSDGPLHLRDTINLIAYEQAAPPSELVNERGDRWLALGEATRLACADNQSAWLATWTVDYGVAPGLYRFAGAAQVSDLTLPVEVRVRNYSHPAVFSEAFEDQLALDLAPNPGQTFYPGETIELAAVWQAQRLMATPYLVSIRVLDKDFAVAGARDITLGDRYPNVLWAPGETVTEDYLVPLDWQAPPGQYQVEFSLVEILGEHDFRFLPVRRTDAPPADHLYPMTVRIFDRAEDRFAPSQKTDIKIGSALVLAGFDLDRSAANRIDLALYWQNEGKLDGDYTVFTQLVGPDGMVWGQQDNQPQAGRYPTSQWTLRDRVVDRYRLTLAAGAPLGQYRLLVGMYDLATGQRLPAVAADGQRLPDDAVFLSAVTFD